MILSDEQKSIIEDTSDVSMVIAGAGSGKSFTMVNKIKYLLDNNILKEDEICAITYTNKAVDSLKNKIYDLTNKNIDVFTFHKLSLNILDRANINYEIVSDDYFDKLIDECFNTNCFGNEILIKIIYKYLNIYVFKEYYYKKFLNSYKYIELKKLIKSFINYMRSNNLEYKWSDLLKKNKYQNILLIIYSLYTLYLNELSSSNLIDFDSMIIKANEVIVNKKIKLPYKYIIIDEFQDTSLLRFNLIKSIVDNYHTKLCVVGDDYQSIYRFQGCDLDLFINFKDYYKDTKVFYLNKTYRNSQELIDVAGAFINKNDRQIQKKLVSDIHLNNPINIVYYFNEENVLIKLLKRIDSEDILILSRNNFDIKKYVNNYEIINNELHIDNVDKRLKYMTIHSSKGLESDVVIILNMSNDIYGMPSRVKDNEVISLLKGEETLDEERRLFYVALTRTKSYVYLLTPMFNESIFVKEIKKANNVNISLII
jgi:DNA helicase-4